MIRGVGRGFISGWWGVVMIAFALAAVMVSQCPFVCISCSSCKLHKDTHVWVTFFRCAFAVGAMDLWRNEGGDLALHNTLIQI